MRGETCTRTHAVYGWFDRTYGLMSIVIDARRLFFGGLRSRGGSTLLAIHLTGTGLSSSMSIQAGTWHIGHSHLDA